MFAQNGMLTQGRGYNDCTLRQCVTKLNSYLEKFRVVLAVLATQCGFPECFPQMSRLKRHQLFNSIPVWCYLFGILSFFSGCGWSPININPPSPQTEKVNHLYKRILYCIIYLVFFNVCILYVYCIIVAYKSSLYQCK